MVCPPPTADCNGDPGDGCEVYVTNHPHHCGSCGHDCLGGACEASTCQPVALAPDEGYSRALAVDGERIYWGVGEGVRTVVASGGIPKLLVQTMPPYGIAVDTGHVYWAINGGPIMRIPKAGGAPAQIAPGGGGDIAVDGTHAYWVDIQTNRVMKVGISGGTVTNLASSQPEPRGIALDTTHVYWPNAGSGTVARMPKAGGGVTVIAAGQGEATAIAVDESQVYWISGYSTIWSAPKSGGPPAR
jgi:hypothetical protein